MSDEERQDFKDLQVDLKDEDYYKSFGHLIAKDKIRWDIWVVLELFNELNINQISQYLKETRFTVSKHLKEMEKDGMLLSREIQPEKRGKYAPKYYRINPEIRKPVLPTGAEITPKDLDKRLKFYKAIVNEYKFGIKNYIKLIKNLSHLIHFFDEKLKNIDKTDKKSIKNLDQLYEVSFTGKNMPVFLGIPIDNQRIDRVLKLYDEFWQKLNKLAAEQFEDPYMKGHSFRLLTIKLPMRLIYEIQKRKFKLPEKE
jgi:DNA-binding transcriptional ArsR family regulator